MTELALAETFGYFAQGLFAVFQPTTFLYLCLGVAMGFWVGILPGVGGPTTLALLIPFTFTMDPFAAFALLLGMISVTSTAGDITAILFGVPGESTNAAIMVDGLPMAKNGQAGPALGAALMSSLMGAIIGGVFLAIGIVLVRPLVLSIGYAEFFMLSLAGIAFLASLSAQAVFKGLAAGALGLLLSTVGLSQMTATPRFTMGSLFLWDGVGFIPAILGLFAIPELIEMATGQTRLPATATNRLGKALTGVRDALRHSWLVLRCSALATYIGLIPGMGASIAQWVAYGHAAQSAKDRASVGNGAIEGVIGPGAACTATQCGSLVPTIGFGVPGSPQMAILLGAFIVQGLVPGPSMLTPEADGGHLTLTFSMVWMIIVANVIVVAACFFFLNQIAKIAYTEENLLIPFILVLIFLGAFANKNSLNDLWVCLAFGVLGWVMVRLEWPRPPLILGLVLGGLIEGNLILTLQAYGMSWMGFPSVLIIFAAIVASIAWPFLRNVLGVSNLAAKRMVPQGATPGSPGNSTTQDHPLADIVLGGGLIVFFSLAIWLSRNWPLSARLMPQAMGVIGIVFAAAQIYRSATLLRGPRGAGIESIMGLPDDARGAARILIAFLAYLLLVYAIGFVYATAGFVAAYLLLFSGLRRPSAVVFGLVGAAFVYGLFGRLLVLPFEDGFVVDTIAPWIDLSLR